MNSQGERPNKSDSTPIHWRSLAASLEAQCENEATNVHSEHGNIENDVDSDVETLTANCPVARRDINLKNDANANVTIGGQHSYLDVSHVVPDENAIDAVDTSFYRNPPTPGNFHDRGIHNLGAMENMENPSDIPVFVDECHRSHSNYEAVMLSLGHFQDNSVSYGQALRRMIPSFHAREREINEQFQRSDQDATEPEHETALFGKFSELTYHDSFNPRRCDQQGQWRTEDDTNAMVAGIAARELNRAPAVDDNVLTSHQHSLQQQQQHSDIAMKHSEHMHRQQEQNPVQTQFHEPFDQNPSSHQTEHFVPPSISRRTMTLKEWIDLHKTQNNRFTPSSYSAGSTDRSLTKSLSTSQQNYIQKCINITVKVIKKIIIGMEQSKLRHNTQPENYDIIGGVIASFDLHEEWEPKPSDVSIEYITVTELTEANHRTDNDDNDDIMDNNKISCDDVQTTIEDINFDVFTDFNWEHSSWVADNKVNGDGEDDAAILHAIGKLLYELLMEGDNLPASVMYASGERPESRERHTSIEGVMEVLQMFASDENMHGDHDDMTNDSGEEQDDVIFTKMRDAALPIPLCRLVSDIFYASSEREESTPYSSDRMTLSDVAFDLEQMIDYPDAFLYASRSSRWELLFGNNHMFGRREELAHLMDAASRVEREDSQKEFFLISGHTGSGKSRLVQESHKQLKERGWKFLRCKFERVIQSDPLSVLALGLDEFFVTSMPYPPVTDISSPTVNNENEECDCFDDSCQRKIIRELDNLVGQDAIRPLSQWMPSLRKSLKESYPAHIDYFEDGLAQLQQQQITEQEVQSLIRLLGLLLELIASVCPVLFFVDDLHWADVSTMALLTSLITIVGTSNSAAGTTCSLLVLGTCRIDDGITEELVLRHLLHELKKSHPIHVSRISLKGFEIESLNEMISSVLCLPRRKTLSLSQVIWEKTQGLPLFVVEFVDTLLAEKVLTESEKHGWEWNVDEIRQQPLAKGVAEVLSRKLESLPTNVSKGLQILSCFASHIDLKVIDAVENYDPGDNTDVTLAIDVAKREYLVDVSGSTVAFSHDVVKIAAFDLIPVTDRIPLMLKLVASLMIKFSSDTADRDVFLFAAVDLMNRIDIDFASNNPQHSQLFAEYNLKAGKRLIELAKFTPASKYLETGISFLQGTGWVDNYDLTLDLINNLARSSYSRGHHQECFIQVNQVLDNATSFKDKFLSYCLYIKLLGIESIDRAVEELYYLLPFVGEPIDLNVITYQMAVDEIMALKQTLCEGQEGILRHLPLMTDCTRLMSMKLLSLLVLYSSQQKEFLGGYVAVKMIRISLQYGQCDDTVYAMAVFCAALADMVNDIDEAYDLAQTTLCLMDNYDTERLIPRVYALIYGTVLSTKDTLSSTLDPLSRACQLAFLHGIHEHAVLNTLVYVKNCLHGGTKLPVLLNELASLAEEHRKINQMNIIIHFLGPVYKTISVLSGIIFNETNILSQYVGGPTHDVIESTIAHNKLVFVKAAVDIILFESLIIRDFRKAADLILKYSSFFDILNKRQSVSSEVNLYFVAGLVSFHMARETRDCNWIQMGTNALAAYEHWALRNCSNFEHKYFLLKAECHHLHGETDAAIQAYNASIQSAHRNGFLQHEAIACELTAHFFGNIGEKMRTKDMIQKSHDVYMEWGAKAKAESVIELLNLRYLDDTVLNTN